MTRPIPTLLIAALAVMGTSCAPNPEAQRRAAIETQRELAKALAGRTAGKPQSCIPSYRSTQMEVIDDQTLLYRDGKTIYLQKPLSACNGLKNGSLTLVTKQYGINQYCRGDINEMVDLRTGMRGASCVFGDFVPYTKP